VLINKRCCTPRGAHTRCSRRTCDRLECTVAPDTSWPRARHAVMGLMWPITWTDTLTPLVPLCCMRWAPHTWPLTQACITLALWNGAGYGGRVGGALASMTVGWTSLTSALPLVPSSPPIPHAPGDVCCANDVQVCVCVGAFVEYMTKSSAWPRSLVAPTATHAAFLLHAARSAHRVCMTLGWCQADQMLSDRGSARVRPFVSSFLFFFIILAKKKKSDRV
jgi:hypothetical protein